MGAQGKNRGVPAQSDYQFMQFKLVNSLRYMKQWNANIIWTAWEDVRQITMPDGTSYSQLIPSGRLLALRMFNSCRPSGDVKSNLCVVIGSGSNVSVRFSVSSVIV